ncbi:hypothetical protein AX16_010482 [Volvariella volvacea WC 439]|nr:hypothetical protein AX16_010482 [Volvariella volvacea WC 439]
MRHRRGPVEVLESTAAHAPRTIPRFAHTQHPTPRPSHSYKNHVLDPAPPAYHPSTPIPSTTKQPFDVFLVLDVEATCHQGTSFDFPNEIIEFPVSLLRWKDKSEDQKASQLQVVDEFRSFVKPTWRPTLSKFCTDLTGITQDQVDAAPTFPEVLASFQQFLIKHGLIDAKTGQRRVRFCWCSDGPFDIRDFVVKQCFISNIPMPDWLQGDVLDVRLAVTHWLNTQPEASLTQQQLDQRPNSRPQSAAIPIVAPPSAKAPPAPPPAPTAIAVGR